MRLYGPTLILGVVFAQSVPACDFLAPDQFDIRPMPGVAMPAPKAPNVELLEVLRGNSPEMPGSCSDSSVVKLWIEAPTPDRSVGYRFEVIRGDAPAGIIPNYPVISRMYKDGGYVYMFPWVQGKNAGFPPIEWTIAVYPVGLGGTEGPPSIIDVDS